MRALRRADRTAADATKETKKMSKRLAALAVTIGAVPLLILPAAQASAASPWWQVLPGSRPSNLWEADPAMTQKVTGELFFGLILAARVEVGGETVGCLGAGTLAGFGGPSADEVCEEATGFAASESAAELEALLEGVYGAGEVEVTGGPAGTLPFEIESAWGPAISASVIEAELFGEVLPMGEGVGAELTSEGSGRLFVTLTDLGDAPVDATSTPLTIEDELPEGAVAYGAEGIAGYHGEAGPVDCEVPSGSRVVCEFEDELSSYEAIEVEVLVALEGSPPEAGAPGKVTVSGGDAPKASAVQTIEVSDEPVEFGVERFDMRAEEEGGAAATQAGAHPFQVTNTVQLNAGAVTRGDRHGFGNSLRVEQPALPRNVRVTFPAGLVGTAEPAPPCDLATFLSIDNLVNHCPQESAIGVAAVTFVENSAFGFSRLAQPIFNLPPQHGEPARFGFMVAGDPVIIDSSVDPDDEYRITGEVRNVTQVVNFYSSTITLWGTPGDPRHDSARGWDCVYLGGGKTGECEPPPLRDEAPFLRMPTSCDKPLEYGAEIEPWNVPIGSVIERVSATGDPLLGCNRVPFDPSIRSNLTSHLAENPSGLDFELRLPDSGFSSPADGAISEAQPKKIEVTLPEGVTLNPSQAEGLATCSPEQYAKERFDSKAGEGCPEASKIGNVQSKTPIFDELLEGAVYVATPHDNPSNSLIALYLVARAPERGILVKQPLEVRLDKRSGRVVTVVDDAPPAPYEYFKLHFREGGRSPLVTPPRCGIFQTAGAFVPYSAYDLAHPAPEELVTRFGATEIERGVDGGACPPGGVPPFEPEFQAGSINNNSGSYSPFNMRLIRHDGEQDMTKFSSVLPPGVLGNLSGVGKCSDAQIAAAKAKSGREEQQSPSCPADSEIGRSLVGAGVGPVLTYIPGKLYLGGPYNGDPLSVIAITPAVAGPYDIGNVVVQEALTLNPRTAEVEVDGSASDPIPHILEGIPAKVRDLRVYVDRDRFILNPTSCAESSAKATLFGGFLDVFSAADDVPVDLATRYQAASCASLDFRPHLGLTLKGGTRRGAYPGLKAIYSPRQGQANVKDLVVRLPRSAFLEQGHIRTICTRVQYAAGRCPEAARYGYIKAWTPLLDEPLQGPVWLRSSNHKLPDMVFDLRGLVDVEVSTRIDSVGGGIRATVEDAPDAPISRVLLRMQGGRKGLIVNSRNLCYRRGRNRASVLGTGQNGRRFKSRPPMQVRCGEARQHKRHRRAQVARESAAG
ncbi:MAG TPA: hypothetical protein VH703_04470 [Solirubrobacterales bacterium]|jgi:hypothetical protein